MALENSAALFLPAQKIKSTLSVRLLSLTGQITAAILRGIHGISLVRFLEAFTALFMDQEIVARLKQRIAKKATRRADRNLSRKRNLCLRLCGAVTIVDALASRDLYSHL